MKYLRLEFYALALLVSSVGCLNLGTETSETGGMGGGGDSGGAGGVGGAGGAPVCPDCTFGRRYGDDAEQTVYQLAMGGDGSVFITGSYNGAMFLGTNVGLVDANGTMEQPFFAKLDTHGTPQWIVNPNNFGSTGGVGSAIAVEGDVVAWGGYVGDVDNLRDIFIETRKLSGGSNISASVKLGSQWHDELAGIAIPSNGKVIYVAGLLWGSSQSYDGCPQLGAFDAGMYPNLVVLALDSSSLSCLWGKTWTGGNHNPGTIRIMAMADGNPVVAGAYSAGTLDGTGLPSGDGAFVMKLDGGTGNVLSAKGFPNVLPLGLTVDRSTDRVIVSGDLTGGLTFAGTTQSGPIAPDISHIALLAYDGALNETWFRPLAGTDGQFCQGISSNGAGRVYAGCLNQGALSLPNGPTITCPTNMAMCGLLVTVNSADGSVLPDKSMAFGLGQPAIAGTTFLTGANSSALVLGGSWVSTITFPDGTALDPIGSSTDHDVVIGKVDPAF